MYWPCFTTIVSLYEVQYMVAEVDPEETLYSLFQRALKLLPSRGRCLQDGVTLRV
jgi:hypothetical protein